jgi:hypothetical protein
MGIHFIKSCFSNVLNVQMSKTFQIIETMLIFQLQGIFFYFKVGGKIPVIDAYFSMYLLNGWNEKR